MEIFDKYCGTPKCLKVRVHPKISKINKNGTLMAGVLILKNMAYVFDNSWEPKMSVTVIVMLSYVKRLKLIIGTHFNAKDYLGFCLGGVN